MYKSNISSKKCRKNQSFYLPIKRNRDGSYKIPPGKIIFTCFTSDFLLKDADLWREQCWQMIRQRSDCMFYFFTKRIDRFEKCMPDDWGTGYDNVIIGCTVENQEMVDYRLPIFRALPVKHRTIIASPLLGEIDISKYLDENIEEVATGGESGTKARPCNFDWILSLRQQCVDKDVPFRFHQTGAHFIKDGKMYRIPRAYQITQAQKADIDYKIGEYFIPEKYASFYDKKEDSDDYEQLTLEM